MGDSPNDPLRVDFDRQIKLEFHGSTVTSDAGLLAYRELDDALGLTSTAVSGLQDTRTGQNTQHSLTALLRQSIYGRLAGYEDVNDAERLCHDPALRTVVGGRAKNQAAASTSEMARFETARRSAPAPARRPGSTLTGSDNVAPPGRTPRSARRSSARAHHRGKNPSSVSSDAVTILGRGTARERQQHGS